MNAEDQPGPVVYRVFIVAQARAICCSHFSEDGAALLHHFGDAKAAAYLDQLAAGYDHLSVLRERVEHKEYRGGVVVHNSGRLRAGDARQQILTMRLAVSAIALFDIVFEVRVVTGDFGHCRERRGRERCPTQVRMNDHSGSIYHSAKCRSGLILEMCDQSSLDLSGGPLARESVL